MRDILRKVPNNDAEVDGTKLTENMNLRFAIKICAGREN